MKRAVILVIGVSLSLVLPLSPLLSSASYALTGDDVVKQTQAWQILAGIQSAPGDNFKDRLTSSQLNSCDFIKEGDYVPDMSGFSNGSGQASYAISIGYTASGGDGKWQAGTPSGGISNSFSVMGMQDCATFGKALGYSPDGAGYKSAGTNTIKENAGKLGQTLAKKINASWGNAPNYIRYQSLINAFEGGTCQAAYRVDYWANDVIEGPSGHSSDQVQENIDAQKNGDTSGMGSGHYYVWSYRDGKVKQNTYYVSSDNYTSAAAGYGLNLNESSDGSMGCTTKTGGSGGVVRWWLAQHKEFADDYAAQTIKEDPGANPAQAQQSSTPTNSANSSCQIPQLGWILCPVLTIGAKIADDSYNFLANNFLEVRSSLVNTDANAKDATGKLIGTGTYKAWGVMRDIANIALVIGFLLIIFSQLTSIGVSNYGIKKLLPRLIVAAVLLNLSFFICQVAVDLANIFGFSIKSLMESIAGRVSSAGGTPAPLGDDGNLAGVVLGIIAATAIVWMNLGALIIAVAGAVIIMLTIFVLLAIRQVLIVLLVVISPLAFVAYLLPNTNALFDRWRKIFTSLLLLFPIIGLLYGAGMLAHSVLAQAAGGDTVFRIFAYLALIVPLIAVIPLLRGALNAVGNIGSAVGKVGAWGKGLSQKAAGGAYENSRLGQFKKYRESEQAKRRGLIQAGAFSGSNKNPLNWGRNAASQANRSFNTSPVSGKFGDRSAAAGREAARKIDYEQIDALKNQLNTQSVTDAPKQGLDSDKYLQGQFEAAIKRGDSVATRAAYSALMEQGQGGVARIQESLSDSAVQESFKNNRANQFELQEHILNKHADVKATDGRVMQWASTGTMKTDGSHINSLNDGQIATQTTSSLEAAKAAGTLTSNDALRILKNPNATNNMKSPQRRILEDIAGPIPPATPPSP